MCPYYIYAIENILNNKIYVGQTVNMGARWNKHKSDIGKQKLPLYFALAKYGVDNFIFYLLEITTIDTIDEREIYWIKHFDSTNKKLGYNIESGGSKHKEISSETKAKISKAMLGNQYRKGIPHDNLSKKKMSLAKKGKAHKHKSHSHTEESKKKIGDANRGQKRSEEFCRQRSIISKNIIFTDEARKNMSIANRGKNSSLTSEDVLDIRTKFSSGLFTKRQLAEAYVITFQSVSQIIRRKTWKHI